MAVTLFDAGWASYNMDWDNPDPYDPVYIQALLYAAYERKSLTRQNLTCFSEYSVEDVYPSKRTPLSYESYEKVFEVIKEIVNTGEFVYAPGTEPDGKQLQYEPEIPADYDIYWYTPAYCFCGVSFSHTGEPFSAFVDFMEFPCRNAPESSWKHWLKCAKQVISACTCTSYLGVNQESFTDAYTLERPDYHSYAPLPLGHGLEASCSFYDIASCDAEAFHTMWEYSFKDYDPSLVASSKIRTWGTMDRRYSVIQCRSYYSSSSMYGLYADAFIMYGALQQLPFTDSLVTNIPDYAFDKKYTIYILTGLPVTLGDVEELHRRSRNTWQYEMEYNSLGYPFKNNEWVALTPAEPLGSTDTQGTGTIFATQANFDEDALVYDLGLLKPPEVPTEENNITWRNSGFAILGMYYDFSEGLKLK